LSCREWSRPASSTGFLRSWSSPLD
jgi:hypothetical protein